MIVFKQKDYVLPALAALGGPTGMGLMMAGGTGISAIQGHIANSANEEAAEEAAREQKRHNKQMEEAAKKNPVLANAVEENQQSFSISQKSYAVAPNPSTMTKATTFAKDMYGMYGGGLKKAAAMTAGFAGIGYAGNKIAQAVKRSDEGEGRFYGRG